MILNVKNGIYYDFVSIYFEQSVIIKFSVIIVT